MQRRKHSKFCLLISVSERRWFVFFFPRGKDKLGGRGGVGRGGRGSLHVTKPMR